MLFLGTFMNTKNPRVELQELFSTEENPIEAAKAWALSVAQSAHIDPKKEHMAFIREIRKANTSLDLKVATYLAQIASGKRIA